MAFIRGNIPAHPDQGRVIHAARLERGISLRALARVLHLSERYVRRLQAGKRCPSGKVAARLGQVLGVALPMPAVDPLTTAQGRRAAQERERERRRELARAASIPRLESYYPAHLTRWN